MHTVSCQRDLKTNSPKKSGLGAVSFYYSLSFRQEHRALDSSFHLSRSLAVLFASSQVMLIVFKSHTHTPRSGCLLERGAWFPDNSTYILVVGLVNPLEL